MRSADFRKRAGPKTAGLVVDIGDAYTKCGFAGENQPRRVFPTHFYRKYSPTREEPTEKLNLTTGVVPLGLEEWVNVLVPFVKDIYFRYLEVNPMDRRVFIIENPYWPYVFKKALAAAFYDVEVPGLMFLPSSALPLYCSGLEDGLVVDVGYTESRILPVTQGHPVSSALLTTPVGMREIHTNFRKLMGEGAKDLVKESAVEDAVVRTCFVSATCCDEKNPGNAKDVSVTTADGAVVAVSGKVRARAAEALFGENHQAFNLAHRVLDSLLRVPTDSIASVVSNVALSGGTAHLPGFARRFLSEVDAGLAIPKYASLKGIAGKIKLFNSRFPGAIMAWVGGSIVGNLDFADEEFLTRDMFAGGVEIPDWSTAHLEQEEEVEDAPAAATEAAYAVY